MSGKQAQKRSQVLAIRAAKLASQGWTHGNIAETLGIKPEQVSARVVLGERLIALSAKEQA